MVLSLEYGTALQDYHFEENSTFLDVEILAVIIFIVKI